MPVNSSDRFLQYLTQKELDFFLLCLALRKYRINPVTDSKQWLTALFPYGLHTRLTLACVILLEIDRARLRKSKSKFVTALDNS